MDNNIIFYEVMQEKSCILAGLRMFLSWQSFHSKLNLIQDCIHSFSVL